MLLNLKDLHYVYSSHCFITLTKVGEVVNQTLKIDFFPHWLLVQCARACRNTRTAHSVASAGTGAHFLLSSACQSLVICPEGCRFQSYCVRCRL